MPTVKGGNVRGVGQSKQSGQHTEEQIKEKMAPSLARDDLRGAFAGNENEGRGTGEKHSTSVKSRNTIASREKTPKR